MYQIPVNYVAVLGAAIASMILGALWYGPLFGKKWIALSGIDPEKMKSAKPNMNKLYGIAFVGSLVMSCVLARAIIVTSSYLTISGATAGLLVGFAAWLGFIAPVTLGSVLWEGKPLRLWVLNNGYQLASLLIMGVILAIS